MRYAGTDVEVTIDGQPIAGITSIEYTRVALDKAPGFVKPISYETSGTFTLRVKSWRAFQAFGIALFLDRWRITDRLVAELHCASVATLVNRSRYGNRKARRALQRLRQISRFVTRAIS